MATAQASKRKGEDVVAKSSKKVKTGEQPAKARVTRSNPTVIEVSKTEVRSVSDSTAKAPAVKPVKPELALKSKSATNGLAAVKSAASVRKVNSKTEEGTIDDEEEIALGGDSDGESDEGETANQAAALLAGFESDSDSDEEDGLPSENIPSVALKGKEKSELAAAKKKGATDEPGTIFIGRVPHGFYEHQMRSYFSQFGNITKLRLSRNKKTGRSKHYAFIEFDSSHVADIVARTMNKYLLFGHILQVRVMPQEQIPEKLWEGANRRYKVVPRAMMEGRNMKAAKTVEQWEKKEQTEKKRRGALKKKMEAIGYDFEMPDLKSASAVQVHKAIAASELGASQAIEPAVAPADEDATAGDQTKAVLDAAIAESVAEEEEVASAKDTAKAKTTKAKKVSKRAAPLESTSEVANKKTKTKDAIKKRTRNSSAA